MVHLDVHRVSLRTLESHPHRAVSLESVASSQQMPRSPVAAKAQNPSIAISRQQPVARSPQLTRSAVAVHVQQPSTVISGQQLGARSQKLSIGARILQ